jgi:hypothetical protein
VAISVDYRFNCLSAEFHRLSIQIFNRRNSVDCRFKFLIGDKFRRLSPQFLIGDIFLRLSMDKSPQWYAMHYEVPIYIFIRNTFDTMMFKMLCRSPHFWTILQLWVLIPVQLKLTKFRFRFLANNISFVFEKTLYICILWHVGICNVYV